MWQTWIEVRIADLIVNLAVLALSAIAVAWYLRDGARR